jgi:hypothetical protein
MGDLDLDAMKGLDLDLDDPQGSLAALSRAGGGAGAAQSGAPALAGGAKGNKSKRKKGGRVTPKKAR